MANTTGRHRPAGRGSVGEGGPGDEGKSWEQRHIRVTFWLERTLREEVREAAKARALSITQFIAQALRRAGRRLRVAQTTGVAILGGLDPGMILRNVTQSRVPEFLTGSPSPCG